MDYKSDPSKYERTYVANPDRYENFTYRPYGKSGLKVSPITVGTWQNFSDLESREQVRSLYLAAFDHGINSFDFGNNYGRPLGSAERLFGEFIAGELKPYRDELIIITKAGYEMWPGPNGRGSSLKYLVSSLDQSLQRMQLDYVDIFYSHRYDPDTPIEETAEALDLIRRSGKALYVGISSYPYDKTLEMYDALKKRGTDLLVHQSNYAIFNRWTEEDILPFCREKGVGFAAFTPLAQGLLTGKYLTQDVSTGRMGNKNSSVYVNDWEKALEAMKGLKELADARGQTMAQMAISWLLHRQEVSTVIIGVRTVEQLKENITLNTEFTSEELERISKLSEGIDTDLWKASRTGQKV